MLSEASATQEVPWQSAPSASATLTPICEAHTVRKGDLNLSSYLDPNVMIPVLLRRRLHRNWSTDELDLSGKAHPCENSAVEECPDTKLEVARLSDRSKNDPAADSLGYVTSLAHQCPKLGADSCIRVITQEA
jgi:hypothetical protein